MLRIVIAIFAGFGLWALLWVVGNAILTRAVPSAFADDGTTSHAGLLVAILAWSVTCSLAAGYTAATVAAVAPLRAAMILGVVNLAVGIGVQVHYWSRMPIWYHLVFLTLLVPGILSGARLRAG